MRMEIVWQLFLKEVRATVRDRRALNSALLMPILLMPIFVVGMPLLLGGLFERETETVSVVALANEAALPPELEALLAAQNVQLEPVPDALKAVQEGDYQAALGLPPDFQAAIAAETPAQVTLYSKPGNLRSELVAGKVRAAVTEYQQGVVRERLAAAGLDPSVLTPVTVTAVDARDEAEQGAGILGWLIPYFIAIFTLVGGQMTAIDATAGEKERGTLESLLVAPVRRAEVVLGKALATMLFGLTAAVAGILSYMVSGRLAQNLAGGEVSAQLGGALRFDASALLLLVVSALLMSGLIAALLIGIAMYARSFKQAQSYIAPLTFVMILPALGLQFVDFIEVSNALYAVPVLNVLLLMNDAVRGQADSLQVLITWGSSLFYAALCLAFAYRNFSREDVIFRS
jgi:sodium transport system permease protein